MGIVQIRPGGGVPLLRRDLRQGFDSLPVPEGNHSHSGTIGHKGQLQLGKQLRHALRATQGIKIHRLRFPSVADAVQRAQALAGKGVSRYSAAAVRISCHGAQIGEALVDGHQSMAVYQGGPQACHAAHIVPAGQVTLAPAVPDAAPGGTGNAPHVVAVAAEDRAVIFAVPDSSQIHQAHDTAGVVLFSGDLSRIDTGGDHGFGLIPEVQRAVAFLDQIVLRVKVVLDGHGAHDPGHIDVALHRSVVPGIGQIPRICGLGRFVRHIFKAILNLLAGTIQNIPQQVGNDTELFIDGVQIVQQDVRAAGHGLPQGAPVVQQAGEDVSQGVSLLLNLAADGLNGDGGHLGQFLHGICQVPADPGRLPQEFLCGIPDFLQCVSHISALLQKLPQTADGVLPLLGGIRQGAEGGGKGTASPFHILQGRAKLLRMGQGVRQPDQSLSQLRQGGRCLGKAALNAGQCRIPRLPLLLGHPLRAAGVPQNA